MLGLCLPVIIVLIFSAFSIFFSAKTIHDLDKQTNQNTYEKAEKRKAIINIIVSVAGALVMFALCHFGYDWLAWIILLFPVIVFVWSFYKRIRMFI